MFLPIWATPGLSFQQKKLPNLTLQEEKLIVFSGCQTT